jgi:hypothetical protein
MHATRIAVVPYDSELETRDMVDEIMRVASALQKQVTEHFEPAWKTDALVVGYSSLNRVPPGYAIVALTRQRLPLGRGGFHYPGSLPGALIHVSGEEAPGAWSLRASHELLEMLGDPSGTATVTGPSVADRKAKAVAPGASVVEGEAAYTEQGLVAYVKELCDPVECSSYEIDGLRVSDFVLPAYYQTYATGRYAFHRAPDRPFGLLAGGYISWTTRPPHATVYQALAPGRDCTPVSDQELRIEKVGPAPGLLSRQWLDSHPATKSSLRSAAAAGTHPPLAGESESESYGERLRTEIGLRLHAYATPPAGVAPYLRVIRKLAWDTDFYERCRRDPKVLEDALREAGQGAHVKVPDLTSVSIASQAAYRELLRGYEQGHRFGYDFSTEEHARMLATMY